MAERTSEKEPLDRATKLHDTPTTQTPLVCENAERPSESRGVLLCANPFVLRPSYILLSRVDGVFDAAVAASGKGLRASHAPESPPSGLTVGASVSGVRPTVRSHSTTISTRAKRPRRFGSVNVAIGSVPLSAAFLNASTEV